MAQVPMTGRFARDDPKHPGWRYQLYPDPASPTGYTRKIWDGRDPSQEYFEPYDFAADQEDADAAEQTIQGVRATQAARQAQQQAQINQSRQSSAAYLGRIADEDARRYNQDYGLKQQQERRAQQDQQARIDLARKQFDEDRRQFDVSTGLKQQGIGIQRDQLGADLLKTGATLRGPLNAFQGFAYAQGVANGGLANYVRGVYGSPTGPSYGGGTATGGSPTPLTLGTLGREMTGQGGGMPGNQPMAAYGLNSPGPLPQAGGMGTYGNLDTLGRQLTPEQQAYLQPIKEAYEGGLANKGLSYLEGMTQGQRDAFKSGGDYLGRDTDSDFEYYQRSRPGQRSALLG